MTTKKKDEEQAKASETQQESNAGVQQVQAPVPTPTVGRMVHYRSAGNEGSAAIITRVHSDTCVNLTVFHDQDSPRSKRVTSALLIDPAYPEAGDGWYWPPRV